jgi:hypothetical protein
MATQQRTRLRRRHFPQEVYDLAQELLNEVPTPTGAEIADRLGQAFDKDAPSPRSVNEWIARGVISVTDADAPWRLTDAAPEDMPLVLEVARALIEASGDKRIRARHPNWPTRAVADWIVRLRRAYPGELSDPWRIYRLAYLARHSEGRWIETTLAFTPWRDRGAALDEARRSHLLPTLEDDDAVAKLKVTFDAFLSLEGKG